MLYGGSAQIALPELCPFQTVPRLKGFAPTASYEYRTCRRQRNRAACLQEVVGHGAGEGAESSSTCPLDKGTCGNAGVEVR